MAQKEFHEIVHKIENVNDVSGLHLHILQVNDALGEFSFEDMAKHEEDHLKDWLEAFHDTVATVADDAGATSYNLTISGGTSPIAFSMTFSE
ncbi:hypothetical protein Har1130_17865 [Haloarcula sp. CBA1130]|uniref:hypothetical protein n=1 Tax=unclassified Haloarcula TaxID=2624677 RepID=UPI001243E3E3|nr:MULTISPECIES: hypothetical protein [unclassified Haloarcula]KAA9396523.1 hypothetical protein Har1130_17865 [Haloarcula sp. CBA1130]KAA9397620.1 hypothetical protein Har1129_04940 [Haloarcula sp. CBA1129]